MGVLTPLESKDLRGKRIIAFDTEDDSNGNVGIINFAYRAKSGKVIHNTFRSPVFARRWVRLQKGDVLFVAHNLEYDLCNIYRDQEFTDVDKLSYTARLIVGELNGLRAKWIDSFNFFPASLKKMGECIGLEKMESDFESVEYCQRDTEIVLVFMERLQQKLIDDVGVGISPTIGGIAMKTFRTNFLTETVQTWNETKALEGYFGGRCELFYKGILEDIKVADVNSMYPDAMTKDYPDCSTLRECSKWDNFEFGLSEVTIHIPEDNYIPPLPYRDKNGRLIFPVGTIRGTWTNHEIHNAIKLHGAKVLSTHYSIGTDTGKKYFEKYVHTFYKLRNESDDEFNRTFYKLLLNNLYGRFSQHNPRIEALTGEMDDETLEETGARLLKTLGHFYIYEIPMLEPPETANWLWGTYVTSYARILLDRSLVAVHKTPGTTIIYCDTDSIFWQGPKEIPGLELDPKKLGAWKIEEFASGDFMIPKGYILKGYPRRVDEKLHKKYPSLKIGDMHTDVKIACKGVPMPRALDIGQIETNENPAYRFLKEGSAVVKRPTRLRAALSRDLVPGAWIDTPKTRKTEYTRRTGGATGPTFPQVFND